MKKPIVRFKGIIIYDAACIQLIEHEPMRYPQDAEYLIHMANESYLYGDGTLKDMLVMSLELAEIDPDTVWANPAQLSPLTPTTSETTICGQKIDLDNLKMVKTGPLLGQTCVFDGRSCAEIPCYLEDFLAELSQFVDVVP